ncbi:uncharacterized protein [Littorina saxatilis]
MSCNSTDEIRMDDLSSDRDLSHNSLEENLRTVQTVFGDFQSFHRQLDDFPHSFQLENQDRLQEDGLKCIRGCLQSALKVGYKTPVETARARNLLAFVLFCLKRPEEALHETQLALNSEGEHLNVVSLANKAVILWREGQRGKAQDLVLNLLRLKNEEPGFDYVLVKAKAELAYSYTRFDPVSYPLAQRLFGEVLHAAKEPELSLWKFGLAFTRRRLLVTVLKPGSADHDEYRDVLSLFLDIVENCESHSLKAKTYAELAWLLLMPRSTDLEEELRKAAGLDVLQACEKALDLDKNDHSVLWKCGRHYRNRGELEKSRQLLERAVAMRQTSKGYHNLANTYKVIILKSDLVYEELAPAFIAQMSRSSSTDSYCSTSGSHLPAMGPVGSSNGECKEASASTPVTSNGECKEASTSTLVTSNGECKEASASTTQPAYQSLDKSTQEAFAMWKMNRSHVKGKQRFSRQDPRVEQAITTLVKAVKISEWGNSPAIFDLACIHEELGELAQARSYFEKLLSNEHRLSMCMKISVFEHLGLILKYMAEKDTCQNDKQQLLGESQSMLLMALKTASELYSKSPTVKGQIKYIWHSFSTLMEALNDKEHCESKKCREKAKLFQLIMDHTQSLAFLQEIAAIEPQKANDPEYLKLCIENHVALQQYNEALIFVDLLQCTAQSQRAMELFDDARYVHKVGLLASQQSLLRNCPNFKSLFKGIFNDYVAEQKLIATSSEDTDTGAESDLAKGDDSNKKGGGTQKATWDVLILHEDHAEDANLSDTVANILRDACGLKVTRNDDDVMPNKLAMEGVLSVMKKSSLVLVIAGQNKTSRKLRQLLTYAARRETSVTLLVNDGHVPKMMKTHRFLDLPVELLHVTSATHGDNFAQDRVAAICKLFGFLTDIDFGHVCEP